MPPISDYDRLALFVERADLVLRSDLYLGTDPDSPGFTFTFNTHRENPMSGSIGMPGFTREQYESAVMRVRTFTLKSEPTYLIDVAASAMNLSVGDLHERGG